MENERPKELIVLEKGIIELISPYQKLQVIDKSTEKTAVEGLAVIRNKEREGESLRDSVVRPLNEQVKFYNTLFRQALLPLRSCDDYLQLELSRYRAKVEEARRKEQERLNRLAEKRAERAEAAGKPLPIPEVIAPIVIGSAKTIETSVGMVTFHQSWYFVVTNPDLIPKEYWDISQSRLDKAAINLKEKTNIPGGYATWKEVPSSRVK